MRTYFDKKTGHILKERMAKQVAAIQNDWLPALRAEFKKPYYAELYQFVEEEYRTQQIYPPANRIFEALELTPLGKVRVVILGQDPYHEPNQAHGLAFSVLPEQRVIPPSLKNIYRELQEELGCYIPNNGYLKKWAEQGVLLLNTVLTVRAHAAFSHRGKGWEQFTDAILRAANSSEHRLVFLLWGRPAQEKLSMIDRERHLVLTSPHPSPLSASRGFFGCGHFQKANDFLRSVGEMSIDWQIENI